MKAFMLTPICVHSPTQRLLVLSDDNLMESGFQTARVKWCLRSIKGQEGVDMKEGDVVTVRRFGKHKLKIIASPTCDYFQPSQGEAEVRSEAVIAA